MQSLKNRRVVVVGGSSGMGLATAQLAHAAGATVIIASRSEQKLSKASAEIGSGVQTFQTDIRSDDSVNGLFEKIGRFDHLVISAADAVLGPFMEVPIQDAQAFFDSKFWGAYRCARAAARQIAPDGSITFLSGAASQRPAPGGSCASVINAAVETLGKCLALELSPVRVNTVSPGIVRTPVWESLVSPSEIEPLFDAVAKRTPVHRAGEPEDVASAVVHIMQNTFLTGITMFVDGGYVLA